MCPLLLIIWVWGPHTFFRIGLRHLLIRRCILYHLEQKLVIRHNARSKGVEFRKDFANV
jgi:hypothetical protein